MTIKGPQEGRRKDAGAIQATRKYQEASRPEKTAQKGSLSNSGLLQAHRQDVSRKLQTRREGRLSGFTTNATDNHLRTTPPHHLAGPPAWKDSSSERPTPIRPMTHESSQERSIGRFAGAAGIRAKPMRAMQMRCPTKVQTVRSAALNQCRYSTRNTDRTTGREGFPCAACCCRCLSRASSPSNRTRPAA